MTNVRGFTYKANRSKMSFGAVFVTYIVVHLFLANVVSGKEYNLTGTNHFRILRGEVITVKGYYKYCLASTHYCPSCIRQIYLNLFSTSRCLASIGKSQLDCLEHHFSETYTAPTTVGTYNIKMQEKLDYACNVNLVSSSGLLVGKVLVQEPPSIVNSSSSPDVVRGDSLVLQCSAHGYPQAVIRWYKDGNLVHENKTLQFSSLKLSDTGLYMCNASNTAGSDTYTVNVLVKERSRPIIKQTILAHNADKLLQNDSVTFTVLFTHDILSGDNALNTTLFWILPHYARYLSHVPETKFSSPYPGECNIEVGQIQHGASMEINITVQIDPDGTLSVGQHFLSIPTFFLYEQRMGNDTAKMFVGSAESVTVNFTVREDFPRGFLMHPFSNEVYFCKEKKSDLAPSCYVSIDGVQWTGIDSRVKMISGIIIHGSYKRIFGVARDNRCHVVSRDGLIWTCIMPEEWQQESSSNNFVHAIFIPKNTKADLPEDKFVASNNDGTVSYGASNTDNTLEITTAVKWRRKDSLTSDLNDKKSGRKMEDATNSSTIGSKGESFELIITKASVCMFVLVLSLIENIAVLVILKKNYSSRMRTANSFFIANMSITDVLFAVQNIPHAYNNYILKGRWILHGNVGMVFCKIDVFFSLIAMVTTNLTILAIAVDRVFAVYIPFKKLITRRVCFFIIFLTWFISTLFASPLLYYADMVNRRDFITCSLTNIDVLKTWYTVLAGILATTLVAMLALYTAIGVKLFRRKLPGNASQRGNARREKRNRDIFKMLITLIVVFYVCSLPLLALQLSYYFGFYEVLLINHVRFIALLMFFMNGAVNPIIYVIFNESFRDGVKVALPKCCRCSRSVVYTVDRHAEATNRRSADRSSTQL